MTGLANQLRLFLCFLFVSVVAFFYGVLLAHILALFGLAVPAGACLMVNVSVSVHPYHAWSGARGWSARGGFSGLFCR